MSLGIVSSAALVVGLLVALLLLAGGVILVFKRENRAAGIALLAVGLLMFLCLAVVFAALIFTISQSSM